MPETKREVKTVEVNYACDDCADGIMKPTGQALMSHPPQYPHRCSNAGKCNARKMFTVQYPVIRYEPVQE